MFSIFLVFTATFNNIWVISWRSVLLAKETKVLGENHQPPASHWQTLPHNVESSRPRDKRDSNSKRYTTNTHDCLLSWCFIGISIISFVAKLVLLAKASPVLEIMQSCKCLSHMSNMSWSWSYSSWIITTYAISAYHRLCNLRFFY
jgi:hypothetical protein